MLSYDKAQPYPRWAAYIRNRIEADYSSISIRTEMMDMDTALGVAFQVGGLRDALILRPGDSWAENIAQAIERLKC